MFDFAKFSEIPEYNSIKYVYKYLPYEHRWGVYEDNVQISSIDIFDVEKIETTGIIETDIEILNDFKKFMKRPEYLLANFDIPNDPSELADVYEALFVGSVFYRVACRNPEADPDDAWPQIDRALKWLRSTDFYTAPASSRFHDSFEGGLCYHSIKVAARAVELMSSYKFNNKDKVGDAVFCALVHDWCKIGLYESFMKNVKNEQTGVWEKEKAYRYRGESFMNLGHGVSSMFLISKFFKLSIEEASAIRWHMGAYRTDSNEFNELQTSNENFMLVHLIQFADQLSLVKY